MSAALQAMITVIASQSQKSPVQLFGGVFVIHAVSFAMCCSSDGRFILVDSHAHGSSGALLAIVPVRRAAEYLEYFFNHHY